MTVKHGANLINTMINDINMHSRESILFFQEPNLSNHR